MVKIVYIDPNTCQAVQLEWDDGSGSSHRNIHTSVCRGEKELCEVIIKCKSMNWHMISISGPERE